MASYNKRGYRPKNKVEEAEVEEQSSTTAEVFNTLDEGASKTEEWVAANQKYILGVIGVVAVVVLGYLAYNQFVLKPKEASAANEMYYPQEYFNQAQTATGASRDSLYTLALEGAEGKYGFLNIIEEYSGTKTADLATYSAGMAYLRTQNYEKAIDYLEDYSSGNLIFGALAKGGIGDAFMQLDQPKEALGYYEKAVSLEANEFTTPRFLYKAGVTALELGDKSKALSYFERIKDEFSSSEQAATIDVFIGMAKN